jgi:hypothetical protein
MKAIATAALSMMLIMMGNAQADNVTNEPKLDLCHVKDHEDPECEGTVYWKLFVGQGGNASIMMPKSYGSKKDCTDAIELSVDGYADATTKKSYWRFLCVPQMLE